MSSIDERVVDMKFNNGQFEAGVKSTMGVLDSLKKALKLDGASRGLDEVSRASKGLNLNGLGGQVDQVGSRFSAMGTIAVGALLSIGAKAATVGAQMINSLTLEPLQAGLAEYELKMGSIQTILANTARYGTKLPEVNANLEKLNEYADKTIYNFGDMTRNIGLFTNAGIKVGDATAMIKGFSNEAAASGTSAQGAAGAAYQLSQALSSGTIRLMDWRSLTNVGMGNKNMQRGLIELADGMGMFTSKTTTAQAAGKDFNSSLEKKWLSADVMANYLKIQAGELSDAQMKNLGLTAKQIDQFKAQAKTAQEAATKVRTWTQLIGTVRESIGSSWAETFGIVIGDFNEATDLWTRANDSLGEMIKGAGKARNDLLNGWKKMGGRTIAIDAIVKAFEALKAIIKPIQDAFNQIFPPTTAKQLYDMTVSIRDFMAGLKIGADTAKNLKRTFAGFFAILGIGWEIVKAGAKFFADLFGSATEGSGGILEVTGSIGDFLVSLHDAIKKGTQLNDFFKKLGSIIAAPIKFIKALGSSIIDMFKGVDTGGVGQAIDGIKGKFEPLSKIGDAVALAWGKIVEVGGQIKDAFAPVGDFLKDLGKKMIDSLKGVDWNLALSAINTGLFAGLVLMVKKFLKGFGGKDMGGGMLDTIKEAIGGLTDTFKSMQTTLKAATLLQLAIAIGIMTAAVVALSQIDSEGLTRALTAITVMFTQLMVTAKIFGAIAGSSKGFAKLPFIAGAMILLAIAVNILASAVKKLADLEWEQLAKGLTGVVVLLVTLAGVSRLMAQNAKGMIKSGAGLLLLAVAIKILASAMTDLKDLSWEQMAKGLISVGTLIGALGLFARFAQVNKGGIKQGAGLLLLAAAIKVLASSVKDFGDMDMSNLAKGIGSIGALLLMLGLFVRLTGNSKNVLATGAALVVVAGAIKILAESVKDMGKMSWEEIGKGMTTMGGALVMIGAALALIPPTSIVNAVSLIIVAQSMKMMADALNGMGKMSWEEIGKGLTTLAGALLIISGAMYLMAGALPGAAALVVVSFALGLLAPILERFGKMSWEEIGKGLLMLAGVFTLIGVAGMLLTPVIPTLMLLAVAIGLIGVAMLAAGAGMLLFGVGLGLVAVAGAGASVVLLGFISGLIALIPQLAIALGLAIIAFAQVISTGGPQFTLAMVTLLTALINAIVTVTPNVIKALIKMIFMFLQALIDAVPKLIRAGTQLILAVLKGLTEAIPKILPAVTKLILTFLKQLGNELPKIADGGAKLIIKLVEGVAKAIDDNAGAMGTAGGKLASAIIRGMASGITNGISEVVTAAREMASRALEAAKSFLGINSPSKEFMKLGEGVNEGFVKGLNGSKKTVETQLNTIRTIMKAAIVGTQRSIDSAQAKVARLQKAKKKDNKAIAAAKRELAQATADHANSVKALALYDKGQLKQKASLVKLGASYDAVTLKLKDAQKALEDAKKTRAQEASNVANQYQVLPDIGAGSKLSVYMAGIQKQADKVTKFQETLEKLRALGMDDTTYKKLLAEGLDVQPFLDKLLAGGSSAITDLNTVNARLSAATKKLGDQAAAELYDSGVRAAEGIVKGLESQQAAISKQMETIAKAMVAAIKKQLKIKSPSRVFMEIGKFTNEGLAEGLTQYSNVVDLAAKRVGDGAVESMRKSISGLSTAISGDMDLNPTIAPVLDLTDVLKGAKKIDSALGGSAISVGANYASAKNASAGYNSNQTGADETYQGPGDTLVFNQYNSSPKALSNAEIYRNTKSQLSVAKGALSA